MHQVETRIEKSSGIFFYMRSTSAVHFYKTNETGICSNVFLLKVATLDLVTKHCWLTGEKPKLQTTKDTCLKGHIDTIET